MTHINIYTDGACSGNPGPGGYGVILEFNGTVKEISGGELNTTNNKMELMSVIAGLSALNKPCEVTVYSDSKYVCDGINKGWVISWRKRNWKKPDNSIAKNVEYWEKILELLEVHQVKFVWVKGHAGHPQNERCDQLATAEAAKFL